MNNTDVLNFIQPFIASIENKHIRSAYMYAFKTSPIKNSSNPYTSLNYEFFDIQMDKIDVINAFKNILDYFCKKTLNKDTTIFQKYSINNPKTVIDFITLPNLDFTNDDILNGSATNLATDSYKIEYLLNSLKTNCAIASRKKDYIKFKHSILQLTDENDNSIYIINKVSPIYKPNGFLFMFNDDDDSCLDDDLKPITKKLLKLPFYPHIIIVNNICFLIQPDVESIFGFEKYNKQVRDSALKQFTEELSCSQSCFDIITSYSNQGRNYNLFSTFDNERYKKIKDKDTETINLLKNTLHIPFDSSNNINITDKTQAEKLVLYLCDSLLQGLDEPDLYESKNSRIINS